MPRHFLSLADWPAEEAEQERVNPFAALSALKNKSN